MFQSEYDYSRWLKIQSSAMSAFLCATIYPYVLYSSQ